MDWKDVGQKVAKIAPALGVAMGGPAGAAIGGMVAAALSVENTPEAVYSAAESQNAPSLQALEARNAEALAAIGLAQLQAEIGDTQDARRMNHEHWMPSALTVTLSVMVMSLVAGLMLVDTPKSNESVIYLISGQVIGAFSTAVAYWLGSSRSSLTKQKALEGRQS